MKAARYLEVPPWVLAEQPLAWQHRALQMMELDELAPTK